MILSAYLRRKLREPLVNMIGSLKLSLLFNEQTPESIFFQKVNELI